MNVVYCTKVRVKFSEDIVARHIDVGFGPVKRRYEMTNFTRFGLHNYLVICNRIEVTIHFE